MSFLIALLTTFQVNHAPWHWSMTCERWQTRSKEIMVDEKLPLAERVKMVYYLRTKVRGKCDILS